MSEIRLKDCCRIKGGSGFPEVYQGQTTGDYPFAKVSDMNLPENSKFLKVANNYVNKDLVSRLGLTVFPENTVVFAKVGAAVYLNKRRLLGVEAIVDNNMMGLTPDGVDPEFLYQFLLAVDFAYHVQPGVLPSLNQQIVGEITLPPLEILEQRKIAKILSTVDNLIEKTQALIDKYQSIKQGMMHDLFTRGVDERGQLRPNYEVAPHLYKGSELGWIPKEWEVELLGDITLKIADRDHYTPIYSEFGIPIVSPKDFNEHDEIDFSNCQYIGSVEHARNRKKTDIVTDDLIFTRIGARLGKSCIVTSDMPEFSLLHSAVMIRSDLSRALPRFLLHTLKTSYFQSQIGKEIQSIGVPDLGMDKIKSFKILTPQKDEQLRIVEKLDSLASKIRAESTYKSKLLNEKSGLMQDLLTGKVRVKVDA
jgi:type I restriction enzyme S subunit